MDLNAFKYLVSIVESGSIIRASEELIVSQTTLRKSIEQLEYDLGYQVLDRGNRGVKLTAKGMDVYNHAKQLCIQANLIQNHLFENENNHRIKIASFGSHVINEQFIKVFEKYSGITEFHLIEEGTLGTLEKVEDKTVDLGIIMYSENQIKTLNQMVLQKGLYIEELFSGQLCIRVHENSNLSNKTSISKDDLIDKMQVYKGYQYNNIFGMDDDVNRLGIKTKKKIVLSGKMYYDCLNNLDAFSVDAWWTCKWKINQSLKRIDFNGEQIKMYCSFITRENFVIYEEIKEFIELLIEAYGEEK